MTIWGIGSTFSLAYNYYERRIAPDDQPTAKADVAKSVHEIHVKAPVKDLVPGSAASNAPSGGMASGPSLYEVVENSRHVAGSIISDVV